MPTSSQGVAALSSRIDVSPLRTKSSTVMAYVLAVSYLTSGNRRSIVTYEGAAALSGSETPSGGLGGVVAAWFGRFGASSDDVEGAVSGGGAGDPEAVGGSGSLAVSGGTLT